MNSVLVSSKELNSLICKRLKSARIVSGYALKKASDELWSRHNEFYSPASIWRLENNYTIKIKLPIVLLLIDVYGCSADYIFGISNIYNNDNSIEISDIDIF